MGLETVEFAISIEEKYGIKMPDEDLADLALVGDIAVYVTNRVNVTTNNDVEIDEVIEFLMDTLAKDYDIPRDKIDLKSHVITDLGLC